MNSNSIQVPLNKHKIRLSGSPGIVPFIGFGNSATVYISGLVVSENGISKPREGESRWNNIKSMIRRYTGNEIENARVKITYRDESKIVTTDKYGIYRCSFNQIAPSKDPWQRFIVTLNHRGLGSRVTAEGHAMIINNGHQFGIISDIDDTILVSYATQKLMKLRLMLLNNAYTRMPFEGVSSFYNALQAGNDGRSYNPIFYVSNSEWNLYDLLFEFIQFNRIPRGPLLLREMAIRYLRPWKIKEVNRDHKIQTITKLLEFYPGMKFILIGDSGQKDPEIYSEIVKHFPNRIPAIYIRDVGIEEKLARVKILSQLVQKDFSTEMVLVKDTEAAARHAVGKGFIHPGYFDLIVQDKHKV